jgi:hypothetical protein
MKLIAQGIFVFNLPLFIYCDQFQKRGCVVSCDADLICFVKGKNYKPEAIYDNGASFEDKSCLSCSPSLRPMASLNISPFSHLPMLLIQLVSEIQIKKVFFSFVYEHIRCFSKSSKEQRQRKWRK